MTQEQLTLLFVSPRFLFPADTGGAIRTTQVLRGMKNGRFKITLVSPTDGKQIEDYAHQLDTICDNFLSWNTSKSGFGFILKRIRYLFSRFPISVATDQSKVAKALIEKELAGNYDLVVFDFIHSVVVAPVHLSIPSLLFTHNVETEIFQRHTEVASNPLLKLIWKSQFGKMAKFESEAVKRFNSVVVVSDRDGVTLQNMSGAKNVSTIPTGVDLDYFKYERPGAEAHIVFSGSMDWLANIDGIEYFMDEVWPLLIQIVPEARMTVVGRHPPANLVAKARSQSLPWTFTGFVDDIRDYIQGAIAYIIPLRVGGGTRMKAYEAMAMGCPVVSTSVGIEGLPVEDGNHYLCANSPSTFSDSVAKLIRDREFGLRLSEQARAHVERNFSYETASRVFEDICCDTVLNNHECK